MNEEGVTSWLLYPYRVVDTLASFYIFHPLQLVGDELIPTKNTHQMNRLSLVLYVFDQVAFFGGGDNRFWAVLIASFHASYPSCACIHLGAVGAGDVPKEMGQLSSLIALALDGNMLSGEEFKGVDPTNHLGTAVAEQLLTLLCSPHYFALGQTKSWTLLRRDCVWS